MLIQQYFNASIDSGHNIIINDVAGDLQQVHQRALQGASDCSCCLGLHGFWHAVPPPLGGDLCLDSNINFTESVSVICVVQKQSKLSFNAV